MASLAPRRAAPIRSAAPLALLAAGALAFEADPRLPWLAGVVGALLFSSAAVARAWQSSRERARLRAVADRMILQGSAQLVAWRSQELAGERSRARLCGEIDRILRALSPARLPSSSPLNRPAVRRNAGLLRLVAARLAGERPVSPHGVLLVEQLLRDARSPLYADRADDLLPRALTRALGALEP